MFSTIVILVYQGGISLLAAQLNAVVTTSMMNELTATGGVILVGLAISSLLEIKRIRVGNMLPGLLVAPLIVWVLGCSNKLPTLSRYITNRRSTIQRSLFRDSCLCRVNPWF
jgi:uncharacterized membrane protein YqgA involved in biofilm formation